MMPHENLEFGRRISGPASSFCEGNALPSLLCTSGAVRCFSDRQVRARLLVLHLFLEAEAQKEEQGSCWGNGILFGIYGV